MDKARQCLNDHDSPLSSGFTREGEGIVLRGLFPSFYFEYLILCILCGQFLLRLQGLTGPMYAKYTEQSGYLADISLKEALQ